MIKVYVDGSSWVEGHRQLMAIGFVVVWDDAHIEASSYIGDGTPMRAEMSAIGLALAYLTREGLVGFEVTLFSDSKRSVQILNGKPGMMPGESYARAEMAKFASLSIRWLPRNHRNMARPDSLAKGARRMPR